MKKVFTTTFCSLLIFYGLSQNTFEYIRLKKQGDSLLNSVADSKNAAIVYSQVLRLPGAKLDIWDYDRAAFAWSLSGNADSAFYYLDIIGNHKEVTFSDYLNVVDDRDFNPIHNDSRWKIVNDKLFANAQKTFYTTLQSSKPKLIINDQMNAAFAWAFNKNYDSAFYFFNKIIDSPSLTFNDAEKIITNGYTKPLKSDNRWNELIQKMYKNALKTFYSKLQRSKGEMIVNDQMNAVSALVFLKNYDSAFYFFNKMIDSPFLTFDDAEKILTTGDTKPLKPDNRWKQGTQKMFETIKTKYIPHNTFTKVKGKRILIDEGHNNLHTIGGTYAALSGVLSTAGFKVKGYNGKFDEVSLKSVDLLIISNPFADVLDSLARRAAAAKQPFRWSDAASKSAYTNEEATAIKQWVKNGGSLLLILDHAPNPIAGNLIAEALGVEIRNVATYDKLYRDPSVDTTVATTIIFTKSKGLLGKHPILNGVDSVTTVTGSSLVGPPQSEVLLYLPATATDQDWLPETRSFRIRSAAGRTQGVAFFHGKGRVVVLGEAAMISADMISKSNRGNWQITLNIFKWLSHVEL